MIDCIENDGILRGQDGRCFSYSYALSYGRVLFVSYFNHLGASELVTKYFEETGA